MKVKLIGVFGGKTLQTVEANLPFPPSVGMSIEIDGVSYLFFVREVVVRTDGTIECHDHSGRDML